MKLQLPYLLILSVPVMLTTGCTKKLVFSTNSTIGLNVSGTAEVPSKVAFSYDRQEAAIVPKKHDDTAHSVYGGLDTDVSWRNGTIIKQTFATGDAAIYATGGAPAGGAPAATEDSNELRNHPLVFITGTSFGLDLSAGEGQVKPDLLLGFKRAEGAYIPVPNNKKEVRSVYADILINTKDPDQESGSPAKSITDHFPTDANGIRIKQSIATGAAAINLAKSEDVQSKLDKASGLKLASEQMNRNHKRAALVIEEIETVLNALNSDKLDDIIQEYENAKAITNLEGKSIKGMKDSRAQFQELLKYAENIAKPAQLPDSSLKQLQDLLDGLKGI